MEDLRKQLKMGELKREILRNALEQANAQASSLLLFTFQWKELEKHFDLVQQIMEKRSDFVESREKELESIMGMLREKREEIDLKENELNLLSKKIEECNVELKFKKEEIDWMHKLLEECSSEFKSKNEELDSIGKSVVDCSKELGLKKEQLCSFQKSISECCEKLKGKELELECLRNSINECSNQLDVRQNELVRSREMIEEQCNQLSENEKRLDSIKSLIQDYEEELEAKSKTHEALEKSVVAIAAKLDYNEKQLRSIDEKISDRSQELCSRHDELDSLLKSIEGCKKLHEAKEEELHSKDKKLKSVQISIERCTKQLRTKEEELISIKNSILECTKELGSKQQQLKALQKSQEEISGMLASKEKQLDLVVKACGERLQEADVKEKLLDSIKRSLDERLDKLEREERQFEDRVKQFELKERQFDSVQKSVEQRSKELELKEKKLTKALDSRVSSDNPVSFFSQANGITNTESVNPVITNQIKTENPENFIIYNANEASTSDPVIDARMDSLSILNEHLHEPDLRKNEVLSALQMSPDPAKFVLDLMQEIYSQHRKNDGTGFEESVLKISLLILEQVLHISPPVQPNVKADAMKLANEWKTKMKLSDENSIEVLCFLQFVAAFGLASSLNRDEIFKLLVTTAQDQQARNICQLLGFTDMISEFVGSLIERKQFIEAVKFVCAFDCKDKFPPNDLLDQFLLDINREACDRFKIGNNPLDVKKATDEQIASLKSFIACVKDCKLESCVPVEVIEERISQLEKQTMNSEFSAVQPGIQGSTPCITGPSVPAVQPGIQGSTPCITGPSVPANQPSPVRKVQQQFHGRINASTPGARSQQQFQGMTNASTPGTRPQGLRNKRVRTGGIVINSYTPHVPLLTPYIRPASLHGLGPPRTPGITRFSSAANFGKSSTSTTRQSTVAEENRLLHNRPRQP